ncbi:MAG TPA: hypothetical protein PKH64_00870 [Petrotogaceae bacterium]|nr:hypothetical protein [Petrotogaceae bacterium]HNY36617.1 hypothetical protein [Petrotogaceae bacterium]HOG34630.1 hypothetical protein [Petrotogaceae bacterium]HPO25856.1 hypothetical protein [Petrotogaceae bacterium]HPX15165.1 hypothetical protein [Petrotogaceae bacterium]
MRSISFIGNEGKKIEITIGYGQYKKTIKTLSQKYGTYTVADSKIKTMMESKSFIKYVRGGEEAKFIDKYLEVADKIVNNDISTLIGIGGGAVLDLCGYTVNTINCNVKNLILYPTTLNSFIQANISGYFFLDMNYSYNYLKVRGYPDIIYIDPEFLSKISGHILRKMFFSGYFLGFLFDKNYCKLSMKYAHNFSGLDVEEYIYENLIFLTYLYSSQEIFLPGSNLIKYFYSKPGDFKKEYTVVFSNIFLFLAYISLSNSYISYEQYVSIKKDMIELELYNKNIMQYIAFDKIGSVIEEVVPHSQSSFRKVLLHKEELKEVLLEFMQSNRGD